MDAILRVIVQNQVGADRETDTLNSVIDLVR